MICWILEKDLNSYMYLCNQEGFKPIIMEKLEDKCHVQMTSNMATTWNMAGYWYQLG